MFKCPFCRSELSSGGRCHSCGARVGLLSELALPFFPSEGEIEVRIRREDGVFVWGIWPLDEFLTTSQAARIMGRTRNRVAHMFEEGWFPNAFRGERSHGGKRRIYIPRRDILEIVGWRRGNLR